MALVYECTDYNSSTGDCYTPVWVDVPDSVLNPSALVSLPIDDPAVGEFIGHVLFIFFLAWFFNFLIKFIMNGR